MLRVHNALSYYINVQAKSYAHVQRQADDDDKGYVSISYGLFATGLHVEDRNVRYCRVALLCAFAFLNILTPIVLAKSLSWYYPRVRAVASGRHFTACLYWAAALIAFLCNVVYTAASLCNHFHNHPAITSCIIELSKCKCSIPSDTSLYKDEDKRVGPHQEGMLYTPPSVIVEMTLHVCMWRNTISLQLSQQQILF